MMGIAYTLLEKNAGWLRAAQERRLAELMADPNAITKAQIGATLVPSLGMIGSAFHPNPLVATAGIFTHGLTAGNAHNLAHLARAYKKRAQKYKELLPVVGGAGLATGGAGGYLLGRSHDK